MTVLRIDVDAQIDLPEQKRIAATLTAHEQQTQRLESFYRQKLDAFDRLKKSLLHEAFSGNL